MISPALACALLSGPPGSADDGAHAAYRAAMHQVLAGLRDDELAAAADAIDRLAATPSTPVLARTPPGPADELPPLFYDPVLAALAAAPQNTSKTARSKGQIS